MIQMTGIQKWYSSTFVKTFVLRGISLEIESGEFVSIMGPSGSGKSTLLHIMGMLDSSNKGEYLFDGETIHKMREGKRSEFHKNNIGFVFQSYHLIDELTVFENIETPLLYKKVNGSERKERVDAMLEEFDLAPKKDLFPHQLSGGEQQRVGVARAVIIKPRVILADEPTGNLNSKQGEQVIKLFTQLHAGGTTIVQVTHSEQCASYSKRVVHLLDGDVVKDEANA
jgi:putative ABC transport system ATP-binding protein